MHMSVNMEDMPIEVLEFEPVNPLISKCQIKVCYVGQEPNRNKSVITKEVATELAKSIPGCPIVGYYNEAEGDFEEHNKIIDISNGKFKIKDTTRPYGFVSMDAKVWFQWFKDDGVPHEYLCCEGYIWTGQFPESQRVIDEGNNQSMELDNKTLNAYWTKDNNGKPKFFIINEAIMSKLCILGEDVEPCFEGASISSVQFSFEDGFKEQLFSLIEKMHEILNNEGGTTPVFNTYAVEIGSSLWDAIYEYIWANHCEEREFSMYLDGIYEEEGGQKFAILRNRKDLTYYRLNFSLTEENGFQPDGELTKVSPDFKPSETAQFALEDIEAYEANFKKSKESEKEQKEETEDNSKSEEISDDDEDEDEKKKKNKYNLEEVTEYQELQADYRKLEEQVKEFKATIESLTKETDELNKQLKPLMEFKAKIDREKKTDLINGTFYMLDDEIKSKYLNNIDEYSYDDIEKDLSVICVRNKVNFNLDTPEKEPEQVTTFNLDSVEDEYSDAPAWVKRVIEVKKEKNLE